MKMQDRAFLRWLQAALAVLVLGVLAGWWLLPGGSDAEDDALYFAETGHSLDDQHGFLSYWRAHDGASLLGLPVTGVLQENGLIVQYFAYGRLESHLQLDGTPVMLGRIGADYADALWLRFEPAPPRRATAGEAYFEATRHTLAEPFLSFWQENGALVGLGYPISQPMWQYVGDEVRQVQYFERGRLEHHPLSSGTPDEVRRSALGRELALLRNYDTAPREPEPTPTTPPTQTPVPTPEPAAPVAEPAPVQEPAAPVAEPAPVQEPAAPVSRGWGGKSITVSLSQQWLYAYEGDVLVFDAPVSTGKDGFNTPVGSFAIYAKTPLQTMSGTINGETYSVPNVPHAMYINGDVALHGTYWHNLFGSGVRPSHGCINLPLYSAAWLYEWAPMGTPVSVTY
jgi:lipoprotein-anchoring transpeptidase ErfK/SrfK